MDRRVAELIAKVEAVNLANEWANKLYERLAPIFTPYVGCKIVKQSGGLLAKIESLLPNDLPCGNRMQVYRQSSNYSLAWTAKACIGLTEGHGCVYHESTAYIADLLNGEVSRIYDRSDRKTDYDYHQIVLLQLQCKEAKKAYEAAKSALFPFSEG